MKSVALPSKVANLSRRAPLFRSPASAAAALFSSSVSSCCLRLKRGRERLMAGGIMSMSPSDDASYSSSSLSSSFSSKSEGELSQLASPKQKSPHPWLIVGLGNPGKMYQATRHNVGFEMMDALAEAEGISMNSVNFKALFGKGFIGNVPVMLAKPQTFMNASGWGNRLILQGSIEASARDLR